MVVSYADWQGGKRCILIDKDRPLLGAKQGRLYLTQRCVIVKYSCVITA